MSHPINLTMSDVGYSQGKTKVAPGAVELAFCQEAEEALEEVFVMATRSSRSIGDIPIRMEVIFGQEHEEKGVRHYMTLKEG